MLARRRCQESVVSEKTCKIFYDVVFDAQAKAVRSRPRCACRFGPHLASQLELAPLFQEREEVVASNLVSSNSQQAAVRPPLLLLTL